MDLVYDHIEQLLEIVDCIDHAGHPVEEFELTHPGDRELVSEGVT